ncbi:hypothetical protein APY03_0790 [Variovorax sp. WDL1]|nr:hypothetical protein APY03_0790 [Variovorax sp. WDL1]
MRFPRIANTLSLRWNSEKLIRECFKALLNPQRAFRIPFPPLIEEELRALAEYRGLKEPPTVSFDEFLEAESETAALAAA